MDAPVTGHGLASPHGTKKLWHGSGVRENAAFRAALLSGYGRNMATLAQHAHVSWWGALDGIAKYCCLSGQRPLFQCSHALLATNGYGLPAWADFGVPAGVVAALPFDDAMRVLRMRSLMFRRLAVRRCIGKDDRARLCQWVGEVALDAIVSLEGAPQLTLQGALDIPPLEETTPEDVAWEGWQLLSRDGMLDCANLFAPVRMLFARNRVAQLNLSYNDIPDEGESLALLDLLPSLFPEWPWSFG